MSPRIRVLLVDDDKDEYEITRDVLVEIKNDYEYVLDWAPSYDEGVAALREGYDVCLLDYRLGDRHGLSIVELALELGIETPIIMLTGYSSRELERLALAAGACDYLVKGTITIASLERSIRHAIARGRIVAALRESERRYRALFDHALDAILVADDHGRYTDANPAALALLGRTREELLGRTVAEISAQPDQGDRGFRAFLAAGTMAGEFELLTSSGESRIVEYRAVSNVLPGQHLSVLRDITERRRAEGQRLRLEAIIDAADDAIDGICPKGLINYWSPGAERLYGYSADEVIGKSKALLIPPDCQRELGEALRQLSQGDALRHIETLRRRKDGTIFQASVSMSPIREHGAVVGISVVTRDISSRKQLERQLAISDRMVSIGTLAAGVAHEINNPLAAVVANLELIQEDLDSIAEHGDSPTTVATLRDNLVDACDGADRIRNIVRDLKLFSRPDEQRRDAVDVYKVLESSARMAWNEIRHRAQLVKDFRAVPRVWGNDARLGQVFLNLIVNAAHAIPEGNAAANQIRLVTFTDDVGMAVVEVHDTGRGIEPDHLPQLFEPFFTTKPVGVGTGLGLPICQRIVHELGGNITVVSEVGLGTVFRVRLPGMPAMAAAAVEQRPRTLSRPPRAGKILVVDDEPMIGDAVERILARDHHVTVVRLAQEAIDRIRVGERYDVILSDVMMPQMTGMDLHAALATIAPEQAEAIVFMTGGAFSENASRFLDRVPNVRVDKPFSPLHLRAVVKERIH